MMSGVKKIVLIVLMNSALFVQAGCSVEDNESDTPYPISPRNAADDPNPPASNKQSDKKLAASPTSTINVPSTVCTTQVTRHAQTSEDKDGAIVTLANMDAFNEPILIYRVLGTLTTQGSFIAVSDMVFGPSGTHPAATYFFELQTADGKSCQFEIAVSEEDTTSKQVINVTANIP